MKKTSFLALSALILMLSFGKVSMAASVSLFDATFDSGASLFTQGSLIGTNPVVSTNGTANDYYAFSVDFDTGLSISVAPASGGTAIFSGIVLYDGSNGAVGSPDQIASVFGAGNLFYEFIAQTGITYFLTVSDNPTDFSLTVATPIPAAVWLFGSALMGLIAFTRRKPVVSTVVT